MEIENVILEAISEKIDKKLFDLWFGSKVHLELHDSTLFVYSPTLFLSEWREKNFKHVLEQVSLDLFAEIYPMQFLVKTSLIPHGISQSSSADAPFKESKSSGTGSTKSSVQTSFSNQAKSSSVLYENSYSERGASNNGNNSEENSVLNYNSKRASKSTSSVHATQISPSKSDPVSKVGTKKKKARQVQKTNTEVEIGYNSSPMFEADNESDTGDVLEVVLDNKSVVSIKQEQEGQNALPETRYPLLKYDPDYEVEESRVADKKKQRGRKRNVIPVPADFFETREVSSSEIPEIFIGSTQATLTSYDRFVVGKSNRAAKVAADFAIEQPGKLNPMFVYGATSVGKTCLLEGICSELYKQSKKKPPFFLTANQFTTLFIQNIRGDGSAFRKRFRNISALVIDDLHYLQHRKQTQIALLGLIDFLRPQGVQLIFSSDRPLSELRDFRSELVSRITSGLVCKIESPERETLSAIFRQMARDLKLEVPEEVCRYVVSCFSTHARQLAGALTRLYAVHKSTGVPITLDMAREALRDLLRNNRKIISLAEVERAVLEVFGLTNSSLRSKSKAKVYCYPRMLAMWLARKHTNAALSEIGNYFGNRSHSTVLSALKRVDVWLDENAPLERDEQIWNIAETISRIERMIA